MAEFALTSPSLSDVSNELGVQDARAWLRRHLDANDDAALARWARTYGLNLCDAAEDAAALEDDDLDDAPIVIPAKDAAE